MSFCKNCGATIRHGVDECPECNTPTFTKDRNARPRSDENEQARRDREALLVADFERKRFNLVPRQEGESIRAFAQRMDREKTPLMLAEHRQLLERLKDNPINDLQKPALPREPGSDDDTQEVRHGQAA